MTRLFVRERPDVVFHAAAHKHVDFLEESPREAILNNVVGTQNVAEAAERAGVRKFVFISTDKAVNPASVMGASKRVGEMLVQCLSRHGKTDFVSVRFGNVLGSDGSVVPIFRRQIELGGPVTVTHPQARRYFMTVSEAARLVIQAGALGRGGQVYVLDMGEQVRVLDVARQLIRLSGLDPGKGIEVRYTGLRPGEKLEEELLTNEEKSRVTEHHRIFAWDAGLADECDLRAEVERIRDAAIEGEPEAIRAILMRIVPEYRPRQVPPALTGLEEMEPAPVPAQDDIRARVLDEGVLPPWKRAMDLAIGSVCLAAAVPLMIGVVAAKLLSGATPLFVVEQRVGANKRGFGRRRLAVSTPIDRRRRDRRSRALPGRLIRCPRFATSAACRHHGAAARVDRFIRNYRLDKLPYLLTVLKGDLSLVGPKPEKLSFAVGMPWEEGAYPDRFLVAPGITGLAQVRGCPDHDAAGFARRLEYDLFYVSHRSLGLDLSTLARTIPVLLSGRRRRHAHRRRTAESGLSDAAATRAAGLRK
jgi:lipopolysaccharide/colanic/teichoic acid biosynthesis glycosyltransferase/nucleoside-diphosphate-sugar epimerase